MQASTAQLLCFRARSSCSCLLDVTAGVSGASVVELKAELYRAQQDARLAQEGLLDEDRRDRRKAGIDVSGILDKRNAGVEQRNAKDALSYKVAGWFELQQGYSSACSLKEQCPAGIAHASLP